MHNAQHHKHNASGPKNIAWEPGSDTKTINIFQSKGFQSNGFGEGPTTSWVRCRAPS